MISNQDTRSVSVQEGHRCNDISVAFVSMCSSRSKLLSGHQSGTFHSAPQIIKDGTIGSSVKPRWYRLDKYHRDPKSPWYLPDDTVNLNGRHNGRSGLQQERAIIKTACLQTVDDLLQCINECIKM